MSTSTPEPDERDHEYAKMLLEQQESDRGWVIFGASILDDDLETLLRAHCLQEANIVKKIVDPLFRVYAPFSTLSAKIHVSFAMALFTEQLHTTLDLIRRIRNDFAHERKSVSFQTPRYQSQLRAILNSSRPESATDKTPAQADDNENIPALGRLSKREFTDRLAFCFTVARASSLISMSRHIPMEPRESQKKP